MRCPYCDANDDKVIDSRASDAGASIRRRRECQSCNKRFTTYEHVEDRRKLTVIKKDGSRVPYDRMNIMGGLEKACYKRPVPSEALIALVDEVEEELSRRFDKEVQAIEIGRAVAERLQNVDQVAYVRFASVYKQFRDVEDFLSEVRDVIENTDIERPEQGWLF
jgi:transcriptional repressor NrdR